MIEIKIELSSDISIDTIRDFNNELIDNLEWWKQCGYIVDYDLDTVSL